MTCGAVLRDGDADRRSLYQAAAYASRRSPPEQSSLARATLGRHLKQAERTSRQP
jgi:hypothetical protein